MTFLGSSPNELRIHTCPLLYATHDDCNFVTIRKTKDIISFLASFPASPLSLRHEDEVLWFLLRCVASRGAAVALSAPSPHLMV